MEETDIPLLYSNDQLLEQLDREQDTELDYDLEEIRGELEWVRKLKQEQLENKCNRLAAENG